MPDRIDDILSKAQLSLEGAISEFVNRRYDNCANRRYYASFQAAVAALAHAGISPSGGVRAWSHRFVQAEFVGELVNRRKLFSPEIRNTLMENYRLRETADYTGESVGEARARRAIRRTEAFVNAIVDKIGS